jgi:hypothetical protein
MAARILYEAGAVGSHKARRSIIAICKYQRLATWLPAFPDTVQRSVNELAETLRRIGDD